MTDDYYNILNIDKNSTLAAIKKAYRQKAKLLHPDINKSPDAQEKFILLNEAYEYLNNLKTGKIYNQKKSSYTNPTTRYKTYQEWQQKERENARDRARTHAQMQYEAFIKTDFYKSTVALNIIADFLSTITVLFIFITPIIGFLIKGIGGLIGGAFIIFITVHYWTDILIHHRPKLSFKELWSAIAHITKTKTFHLIIVTTLNLCLIYRIGFSTLITFGNLSIIFALAIFIGFIISTRLKNKFYKRLMYLGLTPGLVNIFLLLNFLISTNETTEAYMFKHETQWAGWYLQKTTLIKLESDKYNEYFGIRSFVNYEKMKNARTITYKFADGLFGMRVMKSYEFK